MTIYRIVIDRRVEAKTAQEAIESHLEFNSLSAKEEYYLEKFDAYTRYDELASELRGPQELGRGLYWFEVVSIETATDCDEPDEDTNDSYLDAFISGRNQGADVAVGDCTDAN